MEVYDIIHGNISIDPLAKQIIDTEEFQRLRNIKQLGCCNYVFPSATHTRFEHSIGVYHLAGKYINILNREKEYYDEDQKKCIVIAALIHDLGHGPYSHLFDELFDESKDHEYRSIEIFKNMNQKYNLGFTKNDISQIQRIISPKKATIDKKQKFIYQIVSNRNGIDVDRFDYIMRDIKMTGLNYGIEYERIMNHSQIVDGEIVYLEKVKTNIDDFFRVRYIMYKEVYNHHTVRAIEYMMKDFIKGMDKIICINNIIENDNWDDFIRLNDSIVDSIYHYRKMINHVKERMMGPDFSNYGECEFWKENVFSLEDDTQSIKHIDNLIHLIHKIKSREIYKSVGEIITDSDIHIECSKKGIIIDTVKLSYYGSEKCSYIQERSCINKSITIENNTKYITSIYYKTEESKQNAEEILNKCREI